MPNIVKIQIILQWMLISLYLCQNSQFLELSFSGLVCTLGSWAGRLASNNPLAVALLFGSVQSIPAGHQPLFYPKDQELSICNVSAGPPGAVLILLFNIPPFYIHNFIFTLELAFKIWRFLCFVRLVIFLFLNTFPGSPVLCSDS